MVGVYLTLTPLVLQQSLQVSHSTLTCGQALPACCGLQLVPSPHRPVLPALCYCCAACYCSAQFGLTLELEAVGDGLESTAAYKSLQLHARIALGQAQQQ